MVKKIIFILVLVGIAVTLKNNYYDAYSCEDFTVRSNFKFHAITFSKNADFSVTNKKHKDFNFYVNSNFFRPDESVIGGVVIEGRTLNSQLPHGGSFIVKKGKARISFKREKNCQYLSQSLIWAIKNGRANSFLLTQSHSKKKSIRLIIGENSKKEIVVIHSNPLVFVTIEEIINEAQKNGVQNAIILDSGSSVDLKLKNGEYTHSIKSIPSFIKKSILIDEPPVYIACNFR